MDEECERRWREGRSPFDGVTVQSPSLGAEELRHLLREVLSILLDPSVMDYRTFLDWHQHDGYLTRCDVAHQGDLLDSVSTSDKFLAASSDDTYVRRAWYPAGVRFLLRWCVSSDPDDFGLPSGEPAGDFDVTGPDDFVRAVARSVPGSTLTAAKPFFDRVWAG